MGGYIDTFFKIMIEPEPRMSTTLKLTADCVENFQTDCKHDERKKDESTHLSIIY